MVLADEPEARFSASVTARAGTNSLGGRRSLAPTRIVDRWCVRAPPRWSGVDPGISRPAQAAQMDWVRFGRPIRALRKRRRWRQIDLAAAARVSQSVVARIEIGLADRIAPWVLERVAKALGARMTVRLDWNGEALDRLLDAGHATLVERVANLSSGVPDGRWLPRSFWVRGERGSVDLLA